MTIEQQKWCEKCEIHSDLDTRTLLIDPDTAREMLKHQNPNNRKLNSHRLKQYFESIIRGLWKEQPNGISFDEDLILTDGHTRLHAIVKANKPAVMRVTFNCPKEAFLYIDNNQVRNTAQTMKAYGEDPNTIANASVHAMIRHYLDIDSAKASHGVDEICEFYHKYEEPINRLIRLGYCTKGGSSTYRVDAAMSSTMLGIIISTENISDDSLVKIRNIYVRNDVTEPRDKVILDARDRVKGKTTKFPIETLETAIYCWLHNQSKLPSDNTKRIKHYYIGIDNKEVIHNDH